MRAEVADVGIDPADEVAFARVERLPHRVALAGSGTTVDEQARLVHDACPRLGRDPGGGVGRAVVEHHDLVDQLRGLDQLPANRADDVADRGFLVPGRQAHRDGQALLSLPPGEIGRDEVPVMRVPVHGQQCTGSRSGQDQAAPGAATSEEGPGVGANALPGPFRACQDVWAIRAHRERPRDGPCDAAATAIHPGRGPGVVVRCQCPNDE